MFAIEMKPIIFSLICLLFLGCGSEKKPQEVTVEEKIPKSKVETTPKAVEVSEVSLLKEELEGDIEEDASIDIVFKERINDSVNYVISKVESGSCELIHLTTFLNGKNYLSYEIKKDCSFSQKDILQESKDYSREEDGTILFKERVRYIPKSSLASLNDYIEIPDSLFLIDSLVKKIEVNAMGEIEVNQLSDYNHYLNPTFKSVDHEGDFAKVYIVVIDTNANYFDLNKTMYQLSASYKIAIDTFGRYFNTDKNKLILPEENSDEIYAGDYVPRRFEESGISIEYLSFYLEHAKEETFVLIAGMYKSKAEANKLVKKVSKAYKNTWILESNIFIGCSH